MTKVMGIGKTRRKKSWETLKNTLNSGKTDDKYRKEVLTAMGKRFIYMDVKSQSLFKKLMMESVTEKHLH